MAFQIGSNTVINNSRKGTFNTMNIGAYTTATRPTSPSVGDMIFNSSTGRVEYWTGQQWQPA